MKSEQELYQGFTPEEKKQIAEYHDEAKKKYDPELVADVNERVSRWPKEKWDKVRKEWDDVVRELAALKGRPVSDRAVQALIARHHGNLENFYHAPAPVYKGLGQLYVADPRFRKNIDKHGEGMAEYLKEAIDWYCEKGEGHAIRQG